MYEVTIRKSLAAAHKLAEIGGKCEDLHGHNFQVEVTVASEQLNDLGILIDFRTVKKWLSEVLDGLDHKYINDLEAFSGINPSAENMAKFIFQELEKKARAEQVTLSQVKIWESEDAAVTYSKE